MLYATQIGTCHVILLLCIHVWSAKASFKDFAQEISTNHTADILVEDQTQSLGLAKFPRSEHSTNQTAELSVGNHSSYNTSHDLA